MMTTTIKINYKEYPEYMFAIIAAYLPESEGDDLRRVSGKVVFRHDKDGCTYKNGVLHSFNDYPARINQNGMMYWYVNGQLHRNGDLPAIVSPNTSNYYRAWYKKGRCHRDNDLPAIKYSDGTDEWYSNGKLHRENNLPSVIGGDGYCAWQKNGILIRWT